METLSLSATAVRSSPEALNVWRSEHDRHRPQGQSTRPQRTCRLSLQKRVDSHRPTQSQMKLIINKLCCYGNKQENCSNAVNLACFGGATDGGRSGEEQRWVLKKLRCDNAAIKKGNICLNLKKNKKKTSTFFFYRWKYYQLPAPRSLGSSLRCVPWSTGSGRTAEWPAASAVTRGKSCWREAKT